MVSPSRFWMAPDALVLKPRTFRTAHLITAAATRSSMSEAKLFRKVIPLRFRAIGRRLARTPFRKEASAGYSRGRHMTGKAGRSLQRILIQIQQLGKQATAAAVVRAAK